MIPDIDFNLCGKPLPHPERLVPGSSEGKQRPSLISLNERRTHPTPEDQHRTRPPENRAHYDDCFIMRVVSLNLGIIFLINPLNGELTARRAAQEVFTSRY